MKAVSLILCLLLPHAIVGGAIMGAQQPLTDNQRTLNFIDQYPVEMYIEDAMENSAAPVDRNEDSNAAPRTDERVRMSSGEAAATEPQDMREAQEMDSMETNMDRQDQSNKIQTSNSNVASSPSNMVESEEQRKQSQSSEQDNSSMEKESRQITQKNEQKKYTSTQQTRQQDSSRQSEESEMQDRDQNTKSEGIKSNADRKKDDKKSQYKKSEDRKTKYKKMERQQSENENSANSRMPGRTEQRDYAESSERVMRNDSQQPEDQTYESMKERDEMSYEPRQHGDTNMEDRPKKLQRYDYQKTLEQTKYQKNQTKKTKKNKKSYKKQLRKQMTGPSYASSEETRSDESPRVQKYESQYYNSDDSNEDKTMKRSKPSRMPMSDDADSLYRDARSYSSRMEQSMNASMRPINSNIEEWKSFYIPSSNSESEQEDKARDIERLIVELKNNDHIRNATELIKQYFHTDEHEVKTDDGYILTVFRIVPSPLADNKRPPVFMMHGLLGSADDWVLMGKDRSLAYLLAKAGHEVWLGNARGNKYSRRHVSKHPAQSEFWQFSNDEIALHDLPAMIDYALNQSKQEKMIFVGHSQASADFIALVSTRPEYNEKFMAMYALSPTVYMSNTRSPLVRFMAPSSNFYKIMEKKFRDNRFYLSQGWLRMAGSDMCEKSIGSARVCSNVNFVMSGANMEQIDTDMAAVIVTYADAGTSARQMKQLGQQVDSADYNMYDHGAYLNRVMYGSLRPPRYEMASVAVPAALYYGAGDWLVAEADVRRLQRDLRNATAHSLPGFTNMDFLFGKKATKMLYYDLIASMPKSN